MTLKSKVVKHAFKRWKEIENFIRDKKLIFLLLDYDGTLTSIRKRPELAKLSVRTKKILVKLRNNSFFKLAIVSGRPLREIKRLIGIKGIIYAGNHGLELKGPKVEFVNKKALLSKQLLRRIYKKLDDVLSEVKGAFVENKGLTLSVHFRLVKERDIGRLKTALGRLLRPYIRRKKIKITHGKKVYEIRPPVNWDKGKAVKWLLRNRRIVTPNTLPVCLGDDHTDEDMFRAIGRRGISICIGKSDAHSRAGYRLNNTEEVRRFLNKLNILAK